MEDNRSDRERLIALKEESGMKWAEFARYFEIPYRTVQDWKDGKRTMPHYLLRLMEYKRQMEALNVQKEAASLEEES